jgi:hypothetical protein
MENPEIFSINPQFNAERFDNEILLYSASISEGLYLNETAYLVWEMCSKHKTVEEIISLLKIAYPQQKEMIKNDVTQVIKSLVESSTLIICND